MELVVPLGVLDDQTGLGIDPFGGRQHPLLGHADHQFAAVVFPRVAGHRVGAVADLDCLGLAGRIALGARTVGEPEVVDHRLVEQLRRVLEDLLELLLRRPIGVAGNDLPAGRDLADVRGRHAAGDLEARGQEPLLGTGHSFALGPVAAAEDFQVHLGHGRLAAPVDGRGDALLAGEPVAHVGGPEERGKPMDVLLGLSQFPKALGPRRARRVLSQCRSARQREHCRLKGEPCSDEETRGDHVASSGFVTGPSHFRRRSNGSRPAAPANSNIHVPGSGTALAPAPGPSGTSGVALIVTLPPAPMVKRVLHDRVGRQACAARDRGRARAADRAGRHRAA